MRSLSMNSRGIAGSARGALAKVASGLVLALVPVLGPAQAPAQPESYPYGAHMMWGGGWYGMFLGPLFMVVLLVALIGGVALVARWFTPPRYDGHPPQHTSSGRTPLDILKERYARGEIDKQEFEERRRVLGE